MIQRNFCVMLTTFVVTLTAMFSRASMTVGRVLMFLRGRVVRLNCMLLFYQFICSLSMGPIPAPTVGNET